MTKFKVVRERNQGITEIWTDYYDTLKEANEQAITIWEHLLPKEQKYNRVYVAFVKAGKEYLISDDAIDDDNYNENGAFNLDMHSTWDGFEEWAIDGAFDSDGRA